MNQLESFNNVKPINTHTDTGGISGYSSGIIQSCINYAMIGYPHMGYNIGGIVGRQSGYLSGCSNYGHIFGRKDVGGIVGQMEPAFIQQISRNQLQSLGDELDQLQRMIDNAMNHADASSSAISIEINTLANYADAAADSSKRVLDQSADYIDSTIETINDTSTLIIEALDRLDPIIKKLKITSDSFTQTCSQLEKAIKELQIISDDSGAVIHQVNLALDDLKKANQALASAADKLDKALQLLSDAAASGDQEKINEALNQLNEGMRELSDAAHQGSEAMKRFADAMKGSGNASDALEELSLSLSAMSGAITKTNDALKTLIDEIDWTKVSEALKEASDALADVQKASTDFNEGLKKLGSALDELEALNDDLAPLYTQLRKTTRALASTSDDFSDMVREIRKQVKALADKEHSQISGNYFVDTGFAGIDGISYAGIAQPIDYQALKELNTLPSAFFEFTLTFKADNQTIKTIPFDFNEDLSSLTLPAIPEKAGYYASWPAFDYHRMQFSEVLRAQYQPMISVLASDVCIDEKPLVLAQGAFTDQDLLTVSQFKDDNCWQVQLRAKQSENITLRLLKPVDGKVSLWVLNDAGAWVSKPFTDCGSYLQIDMEESELIFCITPKKSYTLLLAGGLTLILIILFIIKKRYSHSQ